jgi:(S)-2-hydroxyglutarate dehydrogenase
VTATSSRRFDVAIIGAGVVGLNLAYWISEVYNYSVLLVDMEPGVGFHQSMRSTGGVHRPVFLDSKYAGGKLVEQSYRLWEVMAEKYGLPFKKIGRITLAVDEKDAFVIERSKKWAFANGLSEDEVEFVTGDEVKRFEPNVSCIVGIVTKKETVTSYVEMCGQLLKLCEDNGVTFAKGVRAEQIKELADGVEIDLRETAADNPLTVRCSFAINVAGGGALRLAKNSGFGRGYVDLHLRGDYYRVVGPVVESIKMQIYPVTRHGIEGIDLSYTGPHLVTRMDGLGGWAKELGPTAAPVLGPYAYRGMAKSTKEAAGRIFGDPYSPRLKMFSKREFMSFAWNQWRMVGSKEKVVAYLQKCIPDLTSSMITGKGYAGIIAEYINDEGVLQEPAHLYGNSSLHVLYAGVGATGSPAYAASLVRELARKGFLSQSRLRGSQNHPLLWRFDFDALN